MPFPIEGREPRAERFAGIARMIEVRKGTRGRAITVPRTLLVIEVKSDRMRRYQGARSGIAASPSLERA